MIICTENPKESTKLLEQISELSGVTALKSVYKTTAAYPAFGKWNVKIYIYNGPQTKHSGIKLMNIYICKKMCEIYGIDESN